MIVVARGLCKPLAGVRVPYGPPAVVKLQTYFDLQVRVLPWVPPEWRNGLRETLEMFYQKLLCLC